MFRIKSSFFSKDSSLSIELNYINIYIAIWQGLG